MLPVKYQSIWPSGFRGEDYLFQPIRNKNYPWRTCLLTDQNQMRQLYIGPLIDASCQISVYLAKRFQRRRFFYFSQSGSRIHHSGHVCWRIRKKPGNFIEHLSKMPPVKNQFIWPSGFERKTFFYFSQSETRIAHSGNVCWGIRTK